MKKFSQKLLPKKLTKYSLQKNKFIGEKSMSSPQINASKLISLDQPDTLITNPPKNTGSKPYLGIISMMKNPQKLSAWINYHLNECLVDYIILLLEDTSEKFYRQFINHPKIHIKSDNIDNKNNYFNLITRQTQKINESLKFIRNLEVEYLLFIDNDELLYLPQGLIPFIDFLENNNQFDNFKISNIEALYTKYEDNLFKTPYFNVYRHDYTAYVNGKSFGNLKNSRITLAGPHQFTGTNIQVPSSLAVILHYESASYQHWCQKFNNYALNNSLDVSNKSIPFPFYNKSIEAFLNKVTQKEKKKIWSKYKMVKYRDPKTYIKIDLKL